MAAVEADDSVRRARHLVTYWQGGAHVVYDCATRRVCRGDARSLAILQLAAHWTRRSAIREAFPQWAAEGVDRTVDELVAGGALEVFASPPSAASEALQAWRKWGPASVFFHQVTHGFVPPVPGTEEVRARRVLVDRDEPPAIKVYGRLQIELPTDFGGGQFADVLRQRRSWREFGDRALTLQEVATLLGLTFGVQRWMHLDGDRRVALKTSPSGGARHSVEAYLLAFDVEDLAPDTYHYDPDAHALTPLAVPTARDLLRDFVPGQPGFHRCPALVVLTSVFARVQWKYDFPRAYRVVLLDVGHLGQTFALAATALGLAPFCTAAINDAGIERHLGIDGVAEAVMFAVGVGARPDGRGPTPSHHSSSTSVTTLPAWARRMERRGGE